MVVPPPVLALLTSSSQPMKAEFPILKHANHSNSTRRLVLHELVGCLQPSPHMWAAPDALLLGLQPVVLPQLAVLESRLAPPVSMGLASTQCTELLHDPMKLLLKLVEVDSPMSLVPRTIQNVVPADLGQPLLPHSSMAMRLGSLEPGLADESMATDPQNCESLRRSWKTPPPTPLSPRSP